MCPRGIGSPALSLSLPKNRILAKELPASDSITANSINADAIYAEFKDLGAEFGPAFRCLREIERGQGFARAWIELPEDLEQTAGQHAAPSTDRCWPSAVFTGGR